MSYPEAAPDQTPTGSPPEPTRRRPPGPPPLVTYTLLGATIFVFLLQSISQLLFGGVDFPAALGLKLNDAILEGEVWRLLTPLLLHGSIIHIGFNMYILYKWGPEIERVYGRQRYLMLYLLSGFSGNVMSFLFTPAPSLGASTAIFGLLGAQAVFFYHNRRLFGQYAQRAVTELALLAGINLLIGLSPMIDNWGHVGGLLGGTLFAWFAGPLLRLEETPTLRRLVDIRPKAESWRAAVSVGLLFSALAAFNFFLQGGLR